MEEKILNEALDELEILADYHEEKAFEIRDIVHNIPGELYRVEKMTDEEQKRRTTNAIKKIISSIKIDADCGADIEKIEKFKEKIALL